MHKTDRLTIFHRGLAAGSIAVVAGIIGEATGLDWWRNDVWVADNITLMVFTFLAVWGLTHRS